MKGLIPSIVIATLLAACSAFLCGGCCYTSVRRGDVSVTRLALLWPTKADSVKVASGNGETWELNKYESDGGTGVAAAVTAAAVSAALK